VGRNFLGIALVLCIVCGTLAYSKPGDAAILTKVGSIASRKVEAALPESSKVAGPVNALRNKDFLSTSDRVQVRIRTDKSMEGANVLVIADGGDIKLRGDVKNPLQRIRALELAQSTAGVDKVTNEIVEPAE